MAGFKIQDYAALKTALDTAINALLKEHNKKTAADLSNKDDRRTHAQVLLAVKNALDADGCRQELKYYTLMGFMYLIHAEIAASYKYWSPMNSCLYRQLDACLQFEVDTSSHEQNILKLRSLNTCQKFFNKILFGDLSIPEKYLAQNIFSSYEGFYKEKDGTTPRLVKQFDDKLNEMIAPLKTACRNYAMSKGDSLQVAEEVSSSAANLGMFKHSSSSVQSEEEAKDEEKSCVV